MIPFWNEPFEYEGMLAQFETCAADIATQPTLERQLERLAFLVNARERTADIAFDPDVYFALVRRIHDRIAPMERSRARAVLMTEATLDPQPCGPYAKRATALYRRVREALQ